MFSQAWNTTKCRLSAVSVKMYCIVVWTVPVCDDADRGHLQNTGLLLCINADDHQHSITHDFYWCSTKTFEYNWTIYT